MRQRYYVVFTGNKGKIQYELTSFRSACTRFNQHKLETKRIKILDANTGELLQEALNGKVIYKANRPSDTEV